MKFLCDIFIGCMYLTIFCLFVPAYAMKRSFSADCVDKKNDNLVLERSASMYTVLKHVKFLGSLKGAAEIELDVLALGSCLQQAELQELAVSRYKSDAGQAPGNVPYGQTILEFIKKLQG